MKQILMFLLFSALLCWLLFAPIYKHVIIMRQAILQKEVDYMLEVGANGWHGYIDAAAVTASRLRLAERGFSPNDLVYQITTDSGANATNPSVPILRGNGIALKISYPYQGLFEIDRLAGIDPPGAGERMAAAGMKMSEYVP
jgi:hypothetical protein